VLPTPDPLDGRSRRGSFADAIDAEPATDRRRQAEERLGEGTLP
jgi:hypothetical protein